MTTVNIGDQVVFETFENDKIEHLIGVIIDIGENKNVAVIRYKDNTKTKKQTVDKRAIKDKVNVLKRWEIEELLYDTPAAIPTGTYIVQPKGTNNIKLIEVGKANNTYFYNYAGDSNIKMLNLNDFITIHAPSAPTEGNYVLEPQVYIYENNLIEIIPYKGKSWHRRLDSADMQLVTPEIATRAIPVEQDFESSGAYLIQDEPPATKPHEQLIQENM